MRGASVRGLALPPDGAPPRGNLDNAYDLINVRRPLPMEPSLLTGRPSLSMTVGRDVFNPARSP
jgi:hypothetical protein